MLCAHVLAIAMEPHLSLRPSLLRAGVVPATQQAVVVCFAPAQIPNECPGFQAGRHLPLTGPERCAGDNARRRAFQ